MFSFIEQPLCARPTDSLSLLEPQKGYFVLINFDSVPTKVIQSCSSLLVEHLDIIQKSIVSFSSRTGYLIRDPDWSLRLGYALGRRAGDFYSKGLNQATCKVSLTRVVLAIS